MSRSVIPIAPTQPSTTVSCMEATSLEDLLSNSTTPPPLLREFYVVQRCWYSGPRQDVAPVDYLRLLESREEAQEAAFHSAMAWSGLPCHMLASVPVRNHHEDELGTTVAYAACGSLFWIRRVWGIVVSQNHNHNPHYHHQYHQISNHSPYRYFNDDENHDSHHQYQHHHHTTAFAVLTEGVIGGTGNRNSRRGVEVSKGHIFLGNPTAARAAALQVARNLQIQAPRNIQVVALPIGKPAEYVTKRFAQEWYHPLISTTPSPPIGAAITFLSTPPSSNTSTKQTWKRSWSDQDDAMAHLEDLTIDPYQRTIQTPWSLSAAAAESSPSTTTTVDRNTLIYQPMPKRPRRCGASHHSFHGKVASPGCSDDDTMDMTVCWS